jgi:hypothetical protein
MLKFFRNLLEESIFLGDRCDAARFEAWVYGWSIAGISGSYPNWGMDVCVLSSRGLCDGRIAHLEELYRVRRVLA